MSARDRWINIIKWAEKMLNLVLTKEKENMWRDYIEWLEDLAERYDYDLNLSFKMNRPKREKIKI